MKNDKSDPWMESFTPAETVLAHIAFIPVAREYVVMMAKNIEATRFLYWTIFDEMVQVGDQ